MDRILMNKKILVIDDDEKLIDLLEGYLAKFGFDVLSATSPGVGLRKMRRLEPDLIILDVMLPNKNGFETCKEIRQESDIPIIMLTARGEVTDRVIGLELGADDYLPKPFEPRELVARISTILRRNEGRPSRNKLVISGLEVDSSARSVALDGEEIELSTAEFDVLYLLASHPGRTFNRDQMMDRLKGAEWAAFDRSVDVLISRLRQKLKDDPKKPRFLKTVWGTGYMFVKKQN